MFSPIMALLFTYCHIWNLFFLLSTLLTDSVSDCKYCWRMVATWRFISFFPTYLWIFAELLQHSKNLCTEIILQRLNSSWNCSWNTIFDSFNTSGEKYLPGMQIWLPNSPSDVSSGNFVLLCFWTKYFLFFAQGEQSG